VWPISTVPGLYRVQHLQARHDFAGREGADLELAVGDLADALGDLLGAAKQRVQALRPAGRHTPGNGLLRVDDGRRGDAAKCQACRGLLQK
jgi:hypothetical protein